MRAWLQLLRFPNLFTVPGDVMAGMALATFCQKDFALSPKIMILSSAAVVCFYCFGLLLNDIHDYREDCRFRPERPLPSQHVSFPAVWLGMLVMLVAGVVFSFAAVQTFLNGLLLIGLILSYNLYFKRYTLLGSFNMGLCRGASFLLGIPFFSWWSPVMSLVLSVAAGLSLYVATITIIAKQEDTTIQHGRYIWLPVILAFCLVLFSGYFMITDMALRQKSFPVSALAWFFSLFCLVTCLYSGFRLHKGAVSPMITRREIGRLIRALIFYQAACLFLLPATFYPAWLILFGWPVSQLCSKYIQSS